MQNDSVTNGAIRAIRANSLKDLDAWLKQHLPKFDVNAQLQMGQQHSTLLHLCAKLGRPQCAKLLMSRGAKANVRDDTQATPLDEAVFSGNLTMAQLLVDSKCDPFIINDRKGTVLHTACSEGHLTMVKWLVEQGLSIEQTDEDGFSPLMWCTNASVHMESEKGEFKPRKRSRELLPQDPRFAEFYRDDGRLTMEFLLSKGANINAVDSQRNTTLMWAGSYNNEPMVALLLRKNCNIQTTNASGDTALASDKTGLVAREFLWRAVEDSDLAAVRRILEEIVKQAVSLPQFGSSHQHHNTFFERLRPYPYVSAFGESQDKDSPFRRPSPLHLAVGQKTSTILMELLQAVEHFGHFLGLAFDNADFEGLHPIHRAVRLANLPAVELLLNVRQSQKGSNHHLQFKAADAKSAATALMHAAHIENRASRIAIFNLLLQHSNCAIDQRDSWGNSVVTHASMRGHSELIEALYQHVQGKGEAWFLGMINAPNRWGNTPLHYSSRCSDEGHANCTRLLLAYGAKPAKNLHGIGPANLSVASFATTAMAPSIGIPGGTVLCEDVTTGKARMAIALVNDVDQNCPKCYLFFLISLSLLFFEMPPKPHIDYAIIVPMTCTG